MGAGEVQEHPPAAAAAGARSPPAPVGPRVFEEWPGNDVSPRTGPRTRTKDKYPALCIAKVGTKYTLPEFSAGVIAAPLNRDALLRIRSSQPDPNPNPNTPLGSAPRSRPPSVHRPSKLWP